MAFAPDAVRTIVPQLSETLFATSVEQPAFAASGSTTDCRGSVRRTDARRRHRMEFHFEASPFRPAELQLRMAVSHDAHVTVLIGGRNVREHVARVTHAPTLHEIVVDITEWTERQREIQVTVDVVFADADGVVTWFEHGAHCASALHQPLDRRYAAMAIAFFLASTLLLLASAIIITGWLSTIQTGYRAFGLLFIAVGYIYVLAGTEIRGLAPRAVLRRQFGRTRKHRSAFVSALVLIALLASGYAGRILYSLYQRHLYTKTVLRAIDGGDPLDAAREAFLRFPWRRESQILIERNAYGFRGGDNKKLQQYLKQLLANKEFKAAALSRESDYRLHLQDKSGLTSDPTVWYVNLLLEAAIEDGQQRGLEILQGRQDDEGVIQRLLIELNTTRSNPVKYAETAESLAQRARWPEKPELRSTFFYQNACDALAAYHIDVAKSLTKECGVNCTDDVRTKVKAHLDDAVGWYRRALLARAETIQSASLQWLRPPQRLRFYHILSGASEPDSRGAKTAMSYAENYAFCQCAVEGITWDKCDKDRLQKQLSSVNEFDEPSKWLLGTVHDAKIINELRTRLDAGWRY